LEVKMFNSPAVQHLLALAVSESSVILDGSYTKPKTWGVYEIEPLASNRSTRRYRLGNHPVRQRELEQEYGTVKRIALFTSRTLAEKLAAQLNAGK
jgi:hypothetical protein